MKKDLPWESLGFGYRKTDYRYVSNYRNGEWDAGGLVAEEVLCLSESACVLHYAQTCFEGLKAFSTADGRTVVFRPDMNARRMEKTAQRLEMPVFPKERFVDAVLETVRANLDWVPPYGTGASLYIRPLLFGSGPVIGVKPAEEYQFRVFVTPVGPYFRGGARPLRLRVSQYDRAAPRGTGHVKAGLNYAMSLHPLTEARRQGYDENLYLDPLTRTRVEETGGANILFVTLDGTVVTPASESILPSITRNSLLTVARDYLRLRTEEREVAYGELASFAECGLCGTAAVISPVGRIDGPNGETCFESGMAQMGPVTRSLYETLLAIQQGLAPAPEGWIRTVAGPENPEKKEEGRG